MRLLPLTQPRRSGAGGGAWGRADRARPRKDGAPHGAPEPNGAARRARPKSRERRASGAPQAFSRRAPSAIAAVVPAKLKRTNPAPRSGSKSTPGVAATPASASIRAQNATLSPVIPVTSA